MSRNVFLFWFMLSVPAMVFMFQQNLYTLKFERNDMVRYNKSMAEDVNIRIFKYNRTYACINFTLTMKIAPLNDFVVLNNQIEVQAYKFQSNEYRLFPLRFMFDFCKSSGINDFGLADIYNCGNFTGCPIPKGRFHICHWAPDAKKFPPLVPAGTYRVDLKYLHGGYEILYTRGYGTIDYPIRP